MSKCQVCEGRAQLFLCTTHIGALQSMLTDLPWWLARLRQSAYGQVRLGDGGRRGTRAHELDEYTGPDDDANAARLERDLAAGKFTIDSALAPVRINGKASRLYDQAYNDLGTWVRHICESRGIDPPATGCVQWLRKNANAIAADEAAGECYAACVDLTDRIRHVVNPPEPPRFCGPCNTTLTAEQRRKLTDAGEADRDTCMVQLYAKRNATAVTCPHCKAEHDIEKLWQELLDRSGDSIFTVRELTDWIMPQFGAPVSDKWIYKWIKRGKIEVAGYSAKGDQMVRLRDVLDLRDNAKFQPAS